MVSANQCSVTQNICHTGVGCLQGRHMHLNSTHLVRSGERQLLQKRGILEAEVMDASIQAAAPLLVRIFQLHLLHHLAHGCLGTVLFGCDMRNRRCHVTSTAHAVPRSAVCVIGAVLCRPSCSTTPRCARC